MKESAAVLKAMGVPVDSIVAEVKQHIKTHTVTTGEGGKVLSKPIPPSDSEVAALVSKCVTGAHLAGVEAWVKKQITELV